MKKNVFLIEREVTEFMNFPHLKKKIFSHLKICVLKNNFQDWLTYVESFIDGEKEPT